MPGLLALSQLLAVVLIVDVYGVNYVAAQSKPDALTGRIVITSVQPASPEDNRGRSFVSRYGLLQRDYESIVGYVDNLSAAVPVRTIDKEARNGRFTASVQFQGTTSEFAAVTGVRVVRGRFLSKRDEKTRNNVVVLGNEAAAQLFLDLEPVGRSVRIGGDTYLVVGRLASVPIPKPKPSKNRRKKIKRPPDPNLNVYIPLATMRTRNERSGLTIKRAAGSFNAEQVELHEIHIKVKDDSRAQATADAIRNLLEKIHPREDYAIKVVKQATR